MLASKWLVQKEPVSHSLGGITAGFISFQFGRLEVQVRVLAALVSSETIFSLCLHVGFPGCLGWKRGGSGTSALKCLCFAPPQTAHWLELTELCSPKPGSGEPGVGEHIGS